MKQQAVPTGHLKNITYGGTFNKTKLVDTIQSVEGVIDVELHEVCYTDGVNGGWTALSGNNYIGSSGSYVVYGLENSLSYVVQD